MDISQIEVFLKVAEEGSFSKAATCLGVTAPAISKQIQKLEDGLKVKLFYRTTRHVSLTEEGDVFYQKAKQAIDDIKEAQAEIQDLKEKPLGVLRLNVPMGFGMIYLKKPLIDFARAYPDVSIDVDFDDGHIDMVDKGYDVVIRIGAFEDTSLIARKLGPCPIILCASPDVAHNAKITTPDDIVNYPMIAYTRQGITREWRYNDKDGKVKTAPFGTNIIRTNSGDMMLEAALSGLGLTLLPQFYVEDHIKAGRLVHILPEYQTFPERTIFALYPEKRYLSTKVRLFLDLIAKECERLSLTL